MLNKSQIDRWFKLSDRLERLKQRGIVSDADIPTVLTPIRQIESHNAETELSSAEIAIQRAEQSERLVGSSLNQGELSPERVRSIVQKGIDSRRKLQNGDVKVYGFAKTVRRF